jgi:diguanylate cyclase (GGDEF)-like protein/PAS domain S-box-containing protein
VPPEDTTEELFPLVETVHGTELGLNELIAAESAVVPSRGRRTLMSRREQDRLRHSEAAKQAAILDALPAYIALVDMAGLIVSANQAWRRLASAGSHHGPGHRIGSNYLEICKNARGAGAAQARKIAAGLRTVLDGHSRTFALEYSTHSPTQRRHFLLTVTALGNETLDGAVVMHLDVTTQWRSEEKLRASELRFRQLAENTSDLFFLIETRTDCMLYVSPAYEEICGRSCASLYAKPEAWTDAIHPEDRASIYEAYRKGMPTGKFTHECRVVRPDGTIRWIEARGAAIRNDAGKIVRVTGVAEDITDRKQSAQALRESERRFSDMLRHVQLASVMLDCEARITFCNEYLLRLTGWREEDVIGRNWFEMFVPPQDTSGKDFFLNLLVGSSAQWHRENEIVTRTGELRLMRWNNSVLRSGGGDVIGSASIGEDITEQRRSEIRIKHLNRVYAVLSGINTLIVRVRGRDELYRQACRIAVEHGGFRMSMIVMVDADVSKLVPVASAGKDAGLLADIRDALSSTDTASNTIVSQVIRTKTAIVSNDSLRDPRVIFGEKYAASGVRSLVVLPLIVADEAVGVLALFSGEREFFHADELKLLTDLTTDISFAIDHIGKQERLDYVAYYDVLTGLANRALFCERLDRAVLHAHERRGRLALALLDVERFRTINDTLGRKAGDQLLLDVARRLSESEVDVGRLARLDADHFAIIISDVQTEAELAHRIQQCLLEVFGSAFRIADAELRLSAKVGIAMFPDDAADCDALLRNADAALKNAKASGEHYLFYTQSMNERVAEKLSLENQLRQAIDREQFELHYQPKVNLASGKITGCEALIRWNDPRTGLVPPGRFIPILEETGLIFEVGRWALRKAVEDYLRWRAAGLAAVRIAVNVSPLQMRNRGFIAEIQDIIGVTGDAAAGLELEMTEGMIMENVKDSITSLQAIRAMGVTTAIDDFGTGFSSLSYLSKLPVDTLKIDRSFVLGMTVEPAGLALVSTIITLARALKLSVVAEGVETQEQSRLLHLLSCDEMQGFLFSKPVPSDVFERSFLTPAP